MNKLAYIAIASTLILLTSSCASTSRDVASERGECKERRIPDHSQYYEDYEECKNY